MGLYELRLGARFGPSFGPGRGTLPLRSVSTPCGVSSLRVGNPQPTVDTSLRFRSEQAERRRVFSLTRWPAPRCAQVERCWLGSKTLKVVSRNEERTGPTGASARRASPEPSCWVLRHSWFTVIPSLARSIERTTLIAPVHLCFGRRPGFVSGTTAAPETPNGQARIRTGAVSNLAEGGGEHGSG
jgi:hypothetical protein